jgi:uncharacterized protein (DUF924 family)
MTIPEAVLEFWFADAGTGVEAVAERSQLWFTGGTSFDDSVREHFEDLPPRALAGELDAWQAEPRTSLALVIALDQFPRNLYRGSARAFAFDSRACEVAEAALERGFDQEIGPLEATFLYLPFEHAENAAAQERCVSIFRTLVQRAPAELRPQFESFVSYAIRHQQVIDRFGRFPHRNAILGRPSTREEQAFLDAGGDTF